MPTNAERRQQTLDNLLAIREEMTRNPKPTYTKDGTTYKWQEYFDSICNAITKLDEEVANNADDAIVEEHTTAWL